MTRIIHEQENLVVYEQKPAYRTVFLGEKGDSVYLPFPYMVYVIKKNLEAVPTGDGYWLYKHQASSRQQKVYKANTIQVGWSATPSLRESRILPLAWPLNYFIANRMLMCCPGNIEGFWHYPFNTISTLGPTMVQHISQNWPVAPDFSIAGYDSHPSFTIDALISQELPAGKIGYLSKYYGLRA